MGSYKFVMASSREAVHEMLVKKSADYAGRPQTYAFYTQTLGKLVGSKVSDIFISTQMVYFCSLFDHVTLVYSKQGGSCHSKMEYLRDYV